MNIIEHDDYNKEADGETVFNLADNPELEVNGKKAFKVLDNIFIVPDKTKYIEPNQGIADEAIVVDKEYNSTPEKCTQYIKMIIKLLKRISKTPSGKFLLEKLSNTRAINYKEINHSTNTLNTIQDGNIKAEPVNVIICPMSGKIKDTHTVSILNKMPENTFQDLVKIGTVTIYINPDLISSFKGEDSRYIAIDPSIVLCHELIHALHQVYGVLPYESKENVITGNMFEEHLTHGGTYVNYLMKNHNDYVNAEFSNLKNWYYSTAVSLNNQDLSPEYKQFVKDKFQFIEDGAGKYDIDPNNFKQFIKDMYFTATESIFAKEINCPTRSHYENIPVFSLFQSNLLDDAIYNVEQGFTKGTVINETPDISKHELLKVLDVMQMEYVPSCSTKKRSAECNISKEELFEKIDTVQNALHRYMKKLCNSIDTQFDPYSYTQEGNAFQLLEKYQLKTTPSKKFTIKEKFISTLTPVNNNTIFLDNNINIKQMSEIYHNVHHKESIKASSENIKDYYPENNKIHTKYPSVGKTINLLNQGTSIATALLLAKKTLEDFSTPESSTTDKVNDTVQLAPFIVEGLSAGMKSTSLVIKSGEKIIESGSRAVSKFVPGLSLLAMGVNVGIDIYNGDYLQAVEDIGIGVLLIFVPELNLPFMLYGVISSIYQEISNALKRKQIEEIIKTRLKQREEYISISGEIKVQNFAFRINNRIMQTVNNIELQLLSSVRSTIHNFQLYLDKLNPKSNEYKELNQYIHKISEEGYNSVNHAVRTIIKDAYGALKNNFIEKFKEQQKLKIVAMNKETVDMLQNVLVQNNNATTQSFVKDQIRIINDYIKKVNIHKILNDEVSKLSTLIDHNLSLYSKYELPVCSIKYNDNQSKFIDTLNTANLDLKNISTVKRADTHALRMKSNSVLTIKITHNMPSFIRNSISLDFWVRFHVFADKNLANNRLAKINISMSNRKKVVAYINHSNITFTIHKFHKQKNIWKDRIISFDITSINLFKWNKVTISYCKHTHKIYLFINKSQLHPINKDLKIAYKAPVHNDKNSITFEGAEQSDKLIYDITDINYYPITLYDNNIKTYYNNDIDDSIIYDYIGNPITEQEYYLFNHLALENHGFIDNVVLQNYQINGFKKIMPGPLDVIKMSYSKNSTIKELIKKSILIKINPKATKSTFKGKVSTLVYFSPQVMVPNLMSLQYNQDISIKVFRLDSYFADANNTLTGIAIDVDKNGLVTNLLKVDNTKKSLNKVYVIPPSIYHYGILYDLLFSKAPDPLTLTHDDNCIVPSITKLNSNDPFAIDKKQCLLNHENFDKIGFYIISKQDVDELP